MGFGVKTPRIIQKTRSATDLQPLKSLMDLPMHGHDLKTALMQSTKKKHIFQEFRLKQRSSGCSL